MSIQLNQPIKPNIEKLTRYLTQVNDSGWYTNFGPLHQQLTQRLEKYLGVENLLLVSNGTLALQVAYKTLNVKSALTTPFSFVATASSLIWEGIETAFSDIDKKSYNLCPKQAKKALELNPAIDTIVATHVYGNSCDVSAFDKLAKQKNVNVIYDAAHAFGVNLSEEVSSEGINKKSILSYGDASTLSFHATKVFHTVEGGAIVFKRKADYERAKRLINFGIDNKGNITEAGINAKLNEYQCAVGLTLLDEIEGVINHRAALFSTYREQLAMQPKIEMPIWHDSSSFNGAYMPIKLQNSEQRARVEQALKENNIECRQYFSPALDAVFTKQQVFLNSNSQALSQTVLCLPLHFYMTMADIVIITNIIKKAL